MVTCSTSESSYFNKRRFWSVVPLQQHDSDNSGNAQLLNFTNITSYSVGATVHSEPLPRLLSFVFRLQFLTPIIFD
jgi:hypothetical protein